MKLTRHNGRSGKHGTYNPRHNDRRFDVENSEHIDAERARQNVYWDCYRGFTTHDFRENPEQPDFSFEEIERMYYYEHYADHVNAQNARNEKTRHIERNRTVDDLLKNNKTCPEESIYQIGTMEESVPPETLALIVSEFYEEFENRFEMCIRDRFWLHAGVAGVAWPSLLARMFSAVVITFFCFSEKNPVRYGKAWIFRLDGSLQKIILRIAVPNGIESGIFQLVKVALSSVAALFGTYQIAANGVAQSIWSVASLVASTMGPVFITVIGQCMGAGDISQAEQYFRKLTKITVGYAIIHGDEFSCLE